MNKNFILGFVSGAILFGAAGAMAVEYAVTANPFPVTVNGAEKAIEGYNINDSTYFKLRDISDAVGGFSVDFQNDTIVLTTAAEATPTTAPTPLPTASTSEPLPDVPVEVIDGVEYVSTGVIERMLDNIGLGDYTFSTTQFFDGSDYSKPSLLTDVPHHPDNSLFIPYDYYISTVVPVINSLR